MENAYQPRISFIGDCYRQLIVKHCSDVYPCLTLSYQRPRCDSLKPIAFQRQLKVRVELV